MRSFIFTLILFASGFVQAQTFDFACEPVEVSTSAEGQTFSIYFTYNEGYYGVQTADDRDFDGHLFIENQQIPSENIEEGAFSVADYSGTIEIQVFGSNVQEIFTIDLTTGHVAFISSTPDASVTTITISPRISNSGKRFSTARSTTTSSTLPYFELIDEGDNTYTLGTSADLDDVEVTVNGVVVDADDSITIGLGFYNIIVKDSNERFVFQQASLEDVLTFEGQLELLSNNGVRFEVDATDDNITYFYNNSDDDVASVTVTQRGAGYVMQPRKLDEGEFPNRLIQSFYEAWGDHFTDGDFDIDYDPTVGFSGNDRAYIDILSLVNESL